MGVTSGVFHGRWDVSFSTNPDSLLIRLAHRACFKMALNGTLLKIADPVLD